MVRRLKREPVSRIFGQKEFWTLTLTITSDVLVPRPETETLVEAALDALQPLKLEKLRILDIGTGSGALLLALLREFPNAFGTGTDISAAALDVARANAARNDLASRCTFIACDIADGVPGPFDLIVSNPPYVARGDIATLAPEVRDYDPILALDGGTDGLDGYRAIAGPSPRPAGAGRPFDRGTGRGPGAGGSCAVYQSRLEDHRSARRFGRYSACAERDRRTITRPQITIADEKNLLECGVETTSFALTESTRTGCIARNPGARGSVWRRRKSEDEPAFNTTAKETGSDASPVGRIRLLNIGGARNEKVGNAATGSRL